MKRSKKQHSSRPFKAKSLIIISIVSVVAMCVVGIRGSTLSGHKGLTVTQTKYPAKDPATGYQNQILQTYFQELDKIGDPFEAFGMQVGEIDPNQLCVSIVGLEKGSNGEVTTKYTTDRTECDVMQTGSLTLDTALVKQRVLIANNKTALDELLVSNGWKVNQLGATIHEQIDYVLRNQAAIEHYVQQNSSEAPEAKRVSYTRTAKDGAICTFEYRTNMYTDAPIAISLSMRCQYR